MDAAGVYQGVEHGQGRRGEHARRRRSVRLLAGAERRRQHAGGRCDQRRQRRAGDQRQRQGRQRTVRGRGLCVLTHGHDMAAAGVRQARDQRGGRSLRLFGGAQLRRQHAGRGGVQREYFGARHQSAARQQVRPVWRALRLHAAERELEPAGVHQGLAQRAERRVRLCDVDQLRRQHDRRRRGRRVVPDAGDRSARLRGRCAAGTGREHLGGRGVRVRPQWHDVERAVVHQGAQRTAVQLVRRPAGAER